MIEHERGFDYACNSCRLLRVADIGLDRAERAVLLALGLLSKRHGQRFEFQRIADDRAGRVAFDIADAVRADPGKLQRIDHRLRLLSQTRGGVAALG